MQQAPVLVFRREPCAAKLATINQWKTRTGASQTSTGRAAEAQAISAGVFAVLPAWDVGMVIIESLGSAGA